MQWYNIQDFNENINYQKLSLTGPEFVYFTIPILKIENKLC